MHRAGPAAGPGHWTAGQHTEPLVVKIEHTAGVFEAAAARLAAGALSAAAAPHERAAVVAPVMRPRGGRTVPNAQPRDRVWAGDGTHDPRGRVHRELAATLHARRP